MSCDHPNNNSPPHQKGGHRRCNCMDGSRMKFPPGYRFQPLDEELLLHYLKKKVDGETLPYQDYMSHKIREVKLYENNPEQLIENHRLDNGEKDWYFFTPRFRKYRNGLRPNRAAGDGYWKATGADKRIYVDGNIVGCRKALVFYKGKPPKGDKTNWIMHEFTMDSSGSGKSRPKANNTQNKDNMELDRWVLCKIYKKVDRVQSERVEAGEELQQGEVQQAEFILEMPQNIPTIPANVAPAVPSNEQPQGLMCFQPNPPCAPLPTYNISQMPNQPQRFPSFQPDHRLIFNGGGTQGNLQDVVEYHRSTPPMVRVHGNSIIHNNGNMLMYNNQQPQLMMMASGPSTISSFDHHLYNTDYNGHSIWNYELGSNDIYYQNMMNITECHSHYDPEASTFPFKSEFVNRMHHGGGDKQSVDSLSENEFNKFTNPAEEESESKISHLSFDESPRHYQQQTTYLTEDQQLDDDS